MGDLRIGARIWIVANFVVHILPGTLLIYWCIRRTFPAECNIFYWHSRPQAIISRKTELNSINADKIVLTVNRHSKADTSSDEFNLCYCHRQITIPTNLPAAVLVRFQGAWLMTFETHRNIVELWCSMTTRGPTDIFHGKLFYVYMLSMKARPVNFHKFMIVAYASIATASTIRASHDKPYML